MKKRISISISASTHKTGKELAEIEDRSFSNYVEKLIRRDYEQQELTTKPDEQTAKTDDRD